MASVYQTLTNVFTNIRNRCGRDSNILTDNILLPFANKAFYQIVRELVENNPDANLHAEIATASLVDGQKEYPLPTDDTASTYGGGSIRIYRVEVSYDSSNWYVAKRKPFTTTEPVISETYVDQYYNAAEPYYAIWDNSLWLFPEPDAASTNGLRIYYSLHPDEIAAASVPSLPRGFFHVLEEGIMTDALQSLGRAGESADSYQKFVIGLRRMRQLDSNSEETMRMTSKLTLKDYR